MASIPHLPAAAAPFEGQGLTCVRGARLVFSDLGFAAGPGDALVLTGPNGSGKSTLLRLMAGLLRPFAGDLRWDGRRVAEDPDGHAARLHYVGHQDAVKPALSVGEMLAFWTRLRTGDDATVTPALQRLGIDHLRDQPGRYLSAGQKRRLALARLAAVPAPLWLLDEPTVSLDRAAVALLEALIAGHRRAGGLVVLSTHLALDLPGHRLLDVSRFAADPYDILAGIPA
jgi:heme exporter protein A